MKKIILHVDVNNAFLSWTAVEMLRNGCKVDIRKRYAVIGGSEEDRRGIVLAKSDLCKARGVVTAESLYSARRKCPYLEVYEGDRNVFKRYSDLMYEYLLRYTNIIERYSIDECFLDYTGSIKLFGDVSCVAYKIKEDIKNLFGFTVNVGIGNNKLEAKMASDFEKPDRVHTLYDDEIKIKMWPLSIDDLFMIGRSTGKKLREQGIFTIGDLANCDRNFLYNKFKKYGYMMWNYANGIDDSLVQFEREDAKSISSSTTLIHNYCDKEEISLVLKMLSMDVGKKLRDSKLYARGVNIWIKYADFEKVSKQIKVDNSVYSDADIYKFAFTLFNRLWDGERYVRALCVGVFDVSRNKNRQLSLFDSDDVNLGSDKLQEVMDEIREKYGNDKIMYANMIKKDKV